MQHRRKACHYADYGTIQEVTLGSMRGTADHSRARVVSRYTPGAKVRLHFYRRVDHEGEEEMSDPPRSLLGCYYATTASCSRPKRMRHRNRTDGMLDVCSTELRWSSLAMGDARLAPLRRAVWMLCWPTSTGGCH